MAEGQEPALQPFDEFLESQRQELRRPQVLLDNINGDRFRIINQVGRIHHNGHRVVVYKVGQNQDQVEDVFFYAKCIHIDPQPYLHDVLIDQAATSERLHDHPNLLGIRRPFTSNNTVYSVLFPYMEFGSLRSIMKRKFQYGLPEDLILVALRETLNGLSVIHQDNQHHKEINAGHIFFNGAHIKLAYSASMFDLDFDIDSSSSSSSYMPMKRICEWASAPEVHGKSFLEAYGNYTKKADVWLIGITALELAYGGIRVKDREDLNSIVKRIINNNRLPRKREGKYLQVKSTKQKIKDGINKLRGKGNAEIFAEQLGRLVIRCLARKPEMRPSVAELLEEDVFRNLARDLVQFHNEVRE